MLDAGVRAGCELHLASFPEPPAPGTLPEGVIARRWLGADEVPALLREMDVMLVPSLSETFGQGLVQAMLTGLPSVVRDVPTLVEKVTGPPEAGLVFADDGGLARAMERLAGDRALRAAMGERARRVALERYVWDTPRFVERYLLPGWQARGRK
jgi:glycosyltransferase involved in cell wall biosynthesis